MSTVIESGLQPARAPAAPWLPWLGLAVGGAALQLAPSAAAAQQLRMDLSMESQVVASSNAGQQPAAQARSDLMLDLHPRMRLQTRGGGHRLDLTAGLIARQYLQGTQDNRIEPELELRSQAELVEGWVSLETTASINSATADPFTGRAESSTDIAPNTFRQSRASITPRLRRDLSPEWQLQAYSENSWQRSADPNGGPGARETTRNENTAVRLERRAMPAGVSAELRRQRQNNPAALRGGTVLALDSARVGAAYRVTPQLVTGLTGGTERSAYLSRDDRDSLFGVSVDWQPNERVWARAATEKRFFGQGFDVGLNYRSPYLAMNAVWTRQPGLSASGLGAGAAGSDMSTLLDNLLTTRIPNPVDRAVAVNRLITERGLPDRLGSAVELVDQTPQLVNNAAVNLLLLGVRHSVAVGLYGRSARELKRAGEVSLGTNAGDFRQRGAQVVASRRLTPTMTTTLSIQRNVTEGLGATAGEYLRDWRARGDVAVALSSRTQATLGIGRELVKSNRSGNRSETRALVGLLHNF